MDFAALFVTPEAGFVVLAPFAAALALVEAEGFAADGLGADACCFAAVVPPPAEEAGNGALIQQQAASASAAARRLIG